jgi:YesN/AraC family two-component response regulator
VSEPAILIIDDNFAIREALTDIISLLLKITIYTAANGMRAYKFSSNEASR